MIELYLRLAGATVLLLLPGALIARSASGAIVVSLALVFAATTIVFATGSSLTLALWLLLAAGVAALAAALRRRRQRLSPGADRAWLLVAAAGVVFGLLLWRLLPPPVGDALFHLARVRKLGAFDELSLEGVGEFADGGLHPGYAFPLWHAFLALVAEIARVDPALVVRREAAVLAPLSFLVVYEAGKALFRSRWLGVAAVAGLLGLTALASNSGGAFRSLALPATAGGRQLLVPAALALLFAHLAEPTCGRLALATAGGFVVAVVHPSYALFLLVLVGGFALVRALVAPEELRTLAAAVGALTLAIGLFLAWLAPVVRETASFRPSEEQRTGREHGFERYPGQFDVRSPDRYTVAPEVLARAGPVPVAALALVPLALLGARRRWGAFVLGSTAAILGILLVPWVFPLFAEGVSLSQARRLAGFLPFAFALAGGAVVVSRLLSWGVLPLALAAGFLVETRWPGDFGYVLGDGGPTVPVWIAAYGGAGAIAAAVLLRSRLPVLERLDWLPAAACALFVAPLAVTTEWTPLRPAEELSAGVLEAVRTAAAPGDVVLADPETSYRISAYAPVYVAVSAPSHVGDTRRNRPYERVREWNRFRAGGEFPRAYDWLLLDRRRAGARDCEPKRYEDERYVLCASTQRR